MTETFTPGPGTGRELRDALGTFATGVTVVTVASERGPLGITANSFASVSLDPPLVLWCPAKASRRYDAFVTAEHFAIHVMGEHQDALTLGFARAGEAFGGCDWSLSDQQVPLLAGCPARFECTTRDRIDAGDHAVIIARVTRVTTEPTRPRLFHAGIYGGFTPMN
jgi:flavin reductase (DIM6/NTAB) family NADH-FMN oxidoreductase RutF